MRWLRDATDERPHPFKGYVEAGAHGPLHAGAPGEVMLAFPPPS
jgi:DNA-binding IclR family transcriptional regulator